MQPALYICEDLVMVTAAWALMGVNLVLEIMSSAVACLRAARAKLLVSLPLCSLLIVL